LNFLSFTDAIKQGYTMKQLQVSLAHTDEATTRGYVRNKVAPTNEIVLQLPSAKKDVYLIESGKIAGKIN